LRMHCHTQLTSFAYALPHPTHLCYVCLRVPGVGHVCFRVVGVGHVWLWDRCGGGACCLWRMSRLVSPCASLCTLVAPYASNPCNPCKQSLHARNGNPCMAILPLAVSHASLYPTAQAAMLQQVPAGSTHSEMKTHQHGRTGLDEDEEVRRFDAATGVVEQDKHSALLDLDANISILKRLAASKQAASRAPLPAAPPHSARHAAWGQARWVGPSTQRPNWH